MKKFDIIQPTKDNENCIFCKELEDDETVFFHITPKKNFNSIIESGFLSAHDLNIGVLKSVSYAKKSSLCIAHFYSDENHKSTDYVVFAVKFDSLNKKGIQINYTPSKKITDIHVYDKSIQPHILGYCEIPKGSFYS